MHPGSHTSRLAGFLAVLIAGVLALRWAIEELRPYLWLFVLVGVLVGLWWLWLFVCRRW